MKPPPTHTILIVDDQEENLQLASNVLAMMGFNIVPAFNGEQMMQRLAAKVPDLILLDILLPETDGVELCRQLKHSDAWAEIPVIFLSAADDKNLVVKALEVGGVDYITKPFNKAELISRVRTHIELKEAKDHLRILANDKDELINVLTHDFKSHLAGVLMSASLLAKRDNLSSDRSAKLIHQICDSTQRMQLFVTQFLANQRATDSIGELKSLPLAAVLQPLVETLTPYADSKSIQLQVTDLKTAPRVRANEEGLRQILDNLLTNAIKFSPREKSVSINCRTEPDGQCLLSIKDEGPGFSKSDREKLFARYSRLSAQPTGGEPSTGLGLSIVKQLADAMRCDLRLISEPEQGAEFILSIPRDGDGTPG